MLEMGMRGFGEIARLCDVGRPTIGVVTAVAAAHTERVGGIDGVARAKAELVEALPADGTAILNADDQRVAAMADADRGRGASRSAGAAGADVRVGDLALDDARPPAVHASHAVGDGRRSRWPSAARTWRSTPPPRSPSPASLGVDARRRGRARSVGAELSADADGGRARGGRRAS